MRAYHNFFRWWGQYPSFAWFGRRILTPLDIRFRNLKSSATNTGTDFPLCYLTTTGRKTGRPRLAPLLYVEHETGSVVTGTNFGADRHPAWALNLLDNSIATLRIDGVESPVRARRLTEQERLQVWPKLTSVWPGYEGYVIRSGRTPLTFLLEPLADG